MQTRLYAHSALHCWNIKTYIKMTKLLFKLISMLAVFLLLLSGSKCAERNGDDEKHIQIEEDMNQNKMKASDMQDNIIENIDNSNDDHDYDDDAKNAGEDLMELDEEQDLVEQDDDDDIRDANEGSMSKEEANNPRRRRFVYRRRRRRFYNRRRRQPGRRRRRWVWKK